MKIAICNVQEFNPQIGGIERVSVALAEQLVKHGIEVIFVSCRKSRYSDVYKLPAVQFRLPNDADYAEENINHFVKIIHREKVDIILNQNAHSFHFNRFLEDVKKITRTPIVSVLHFCPDMRIRSNRNRFDWNFYTITHNIINLARDVATRIPFKYLTMLQHGKMYNHLYNISDRTVLLSNNYIDDYTKIAHLKENSKLCAINNMLSFPYTPDFCVNKKKQILYCGRFTPQKNPYRVLYVWKKIMNKLPDWELILIGDGPMKKRCETLSGEMHLQRITFLGFQDPIEYYKQSSILLMSSNYEGWPLVLTESMLYGCVPIAFNSFGSITDIITDGLNGKLVSPFDIDEMSISVMNLIESGKLSNYAAEANKSVQRFAPEQICKQWIKIFNEVNK